MPTPTSNDHDGFFRRGMTRSERGDHEGAEKEFTAAIESGAGDPVVHFLRGASRLKLRNWTGAEADFTVALKGMRHASVHVLRGTSRCRQHHYVPSVLDFGAAAFLAVKDRLQSLFHRRALIVL